jgi:hypothetical protein
LSSLPRSPSSQLVEEHLLNHLAIEQALSKTWFYPFELADGRRTESYEGGILDAIHHTRLNMLKGEVHSRFSSLHGLTAVDLACHQGWFAHQLKELGVGDVLAVDARPEHIADVALINQAARSQVRTHLSDVHAVSKEQIGTFDIVLCLGLIYHLENPVGALRKARELCQGLCFVETQVVPHMSGNIDWGSYRFVKPLEGVFGIIDETEETHGPEMSTTGICLAPSVPALLWIMQKIGFKNVRLLAPPADAYEQLRYGKRVMVCGEV